jgi:hypothetical protein
MYPPGRLFLGLYTRRNTGSSGLRFPLLILFVVTLTIQVTTAPTSNLTFILDLPQQAQTARTSRCVCGVRHSTGLWEITIVATKNVRRGAYILRRFYMKRHYLLNEVAQLVGTLPHRIAYAITNRHLPEPEERLNNHRLFTEADIMRIKMYFDHKKSKANREATG